MRFWNLLTSRRVHDELVAMARMVADQCREPLWQVAGPRAVTMTTAEARGYIRAHAAPVVQRAVDGALHEHPMLGADARATLLAEVRVQVVRDVLRRALDGQLWHTMRRRAA